MAQFVHFWRGTLSFDGNLALFCLVYLSRCFLWIVITLYILFFFSFCVGKLILRLVGRTRTLLRRKRKPEIARTTSERRPTETLATLLAHSLLHLTWSVLASCCLCFAGMKPQKIQPIDAYLRTLEMQLILYIFCCIYFEPTSHTHFTGQSN